MEELTQTLIFDFVLVKLRITKELEKLKTAVIALVMALN